MCFDVKYREKRIFFFWRVILEGRENMLVFNEQIKTPWDQLLGETRLVVVSPLPMSGPELSAVLCPFHILFGIGKLLPK